MNKILLSVFAITQILSTSASAAPRRITLVIDGQTNKTVWREVAQGVRLAAEILAKKGSQIRLETLDSGTTALGTRTAMLELMKSPPDVVIAEIDSSKAEVAAELAEKNKLPMITPFATSPSVTAGREFVFRACVSDAQLGTLLSKIAATRMGAKRAAIVFDSGQLYSTTLRAKFKESFLEQGGSIAFDAPILSTQNDFKSVVTQLMESKPDVVFLPFYEETVGRFLAQASKIPGFSKLKLLGGDGWASADFFKNGSEEIRQLKGMWITHHDPERRSNDAKRFFDAFKKRFGVEPKTSAAYLGYDAFLIAERAIGNTSVSLGGTELRDRIRNMKEIKGTSGTLSFNGGSEPEKPVFIMSHENGKFTVSGEIQ